jgi:exodeoxyribonuclease-3
VKIATWNVNSIRARKERVLAWLAKARPDVVCLQELKCQEAEVPMDELGALGYQAAILGQKTYNGVAILSRTPLGDVRRGFDDGGDESQARAIAATVAGLRVVSVYVPNGQAVDSDKYRYKLEWLERLRGFVAAELGRNERLVVGGDYNVAPAPIDVHDPAAWEGEVLFSPPERAALAAVVETGLVDLYRRLHPDEQTFTWWDYRMLAFPKNKGLRIDHLLVSRKVAAQAQSCVVDRDERKGQQPSDHAPVVAEIGA